MSGKDGVEVIICPFTVNIIISSILSVFLMSDLMLSLMKFFNFSVGFSGQNNLVTCGADLEQAKKVFTKK